MATDSQIDSDYYSLYLMIIYAYINRFCTKYAEPDIPTINEPCVHNQKCLRNITVVLVVV